MITTQRSFSFLTLPGFDLLCRRVRNMSVANEAVKSSRPSFSDKPNKSPLCKTWTECRVDLIFNGNERVSRKIEITETIGPHALSSQSSAQEDSDCLCARDPCCFKTEALRRLISSNITNPSWEREISCIGVRGTLVLSG